MALSEMQVFNEYYKDAIMLTIEQRLNAFNEASGGAIRLVFNGFEGDFYLRSLWSRIGMATRRVDRYATNDDVAPVDLTQDKQVFVKVAGGVGPLRYEPSQFTWTEIPEASTVELVSRNVADLIVQDMLNTGIGCAVAGISNNADATFNATNGLTYPAMNRSHALFGDMSNQLITMIMDGATYHSLIGQNLTNAATLFQAANVTVVNILNKRIVITDAPQLTNGDNHHILTLTEDGIVVRDGGDLVTAIQTITGKQRIYTQLQMDYAFGVGLRGYSWDETNGGKSPTDEKLFTGSNWVKIEDDLSVKHTAGVIATGALVLA